MSSDRTSGAGAAVQKPRHRRSPGLSLTKGVDRIHWRHVPAQSAALKRHHRISASTCDCARHVRVGVCTQKGIWDSEAKANTPWRRRLRDFDTAMGLTVWGRHCLGAIALQG